MRRSQGRVLAGVATGLADHLGVDVFVVRLVFTILAAAGGAGVLVYVALWVFTPEEPAPPDRTPSVDLAQLVSFAALTLGIVLLADLAGLRLGGTGWWPVVAVVAGGSLIWRRGGEVRIRAWFARPEVTLRRGGRGGALRIGAGAVLVVAGLAGFLAANGALEEARQGLLAIVVVVVGLALVTGPWWWRLASELTAERRERIRTQERAELAARIHDSVLHTLALIQRHADDPKEVVRLARGQERDLRSWLYRQPAGVTPEKLGTAVEQAAAEVEDSFGVPIEVVVVGDAPLDEPLQGLVQAAREAMVNAAKSSGAPTVSVYAEVEPDEVNVFVRDRGSGFDLGSVPPDRYGIKESIVGRMARYGGSAEVKTAPGEGTEVRIRMSRRAP